MGNKTLQTINKYTLILGSIVMALSYVPQIMKIWDAQSSEGVSFLFISMVTFAIATFTLNGYVIYTKNKDVSVLLAQLANLIPALILCVLIIMFS